MPPDPLVGRAVRVPRLGGGKFEFRPTPVLIVNTSIVISSKRQVLPHFHTRKHLIFAWFLIEFRR